MIDRREFIAISVASFAHARARSTTPLRIAAVLEDPANDEALGFEFGLLEARRTASLLGWDVAHARDVREAHALIVASAGVSSHAEAPVLRIRHDGEHTPDGSFCLGADAPDRTAWHGALERFGAQQLNDRYRRAIRKDMSGDAWTAWFAVKIVTDSALRLRSNDPARLLAHLGSADAHFDGHKGVPLRFDSTRHLVQPLYDPPVR